MPPTKVVIHGATGKMGTETVNAVCREDDLTLVGATCGWERDNVLALPTGGEGRLWGENRKVTVEEALRIYTLHGAYAGFEENIKGSIEPGKLADLVVLGEDPTAVDPLTIKDIPVLQTIVGGETVYGG